MTDSYVPEMPEKENIEIPEKEKLEPPEEGKAEKKEKEKGKKSDKIEKKIKIQAQDTGIIAKELLIAAIETKSIYVNVSNPIEYAERLGEAYNTLLKKIEKR